MDGMFPMLMQPDTVRNYRNKNTCIFQGNFESCLGLLTKYPSLARHNRVIPSWIPGYKTNNEACHPTKTEATKQLLGSEPGCGFLV